MLPLFYNENIEICKNLIDVIISNDLKVIEFTNRGIKAKQNFKILVEYLNQHKSIDLGAGSIKNAQEAIDFIDSGAKFIVSPFLD